MELTKEYFDEQLTIKFKDIATKKDIQETAERLVESFYQSAEAEHQYFENRFSEQSKNIKKFTLDQNQKLFQILERDLTENRDYLEKKFQSIEQKLDIRERIQVMEIKFHKLENRLDIEL
jgi:hypothetical protein